MAMTPAFGINDNGQIVGVMYYQTGAPCAAGADAFSYSNGSWSDYGPGAAYAVNASGQVAGTLTNVTTDQSGDCKVLGTIAFLNSNGTTNSLGTLPGGNNSIGYAINVSGRVVGSSDFTGSTATQRFGAAVGKTVIRVMCEESKARAVWCKEMRAAGDEIHVRFRFRPQSMSR